ncbi:MAG TPA: preprotein translocase subunit SecG [Patescibacteria group bacterium]|nr:preprotein translocase subunit SecG [Patescibacteria group bacterium]
MDILGILQAIIAVLLITSILLQNRGTGLSVAFGGSFGASYHTKRGLEKFLFYCSIVLSILFIAIAIVQVMAA